MRVELLEQRWRPAPWDLLFIHDPKPRVIARAPFRDRVVHTALANLIEPRFERSYLPEDFACRRHMGTHRARVRLLELVRRHRLAVHLDVRSYFPSIDVDLLRGLLERRIDDERFLAVVSRVLEAGRGLNDSSRVRRHARIAPDWPPPGRGLPIGALTSQLFAAHVYLLEFDHFVKRELKVPGYVRYVDDIFCFGERRAELRAWRAAIGQWLEARRGLRLKRPDARVLSCGGHIDALGVRITRDGIEPLRRSFTRLRAQLARDARDPRVDTRAIEAALRSRIGNLLFL